MLNFDPHRWLTEHAQSQPAPGLAGLAGLAGAASETEKPVSKFAPAKVAKAANRGSCQATLVKLDPKLPLHGLDARRWGQLLRDAEWLLENYTRQAALDGWGGVVDRLRGSRSLVMTADLACWRRMHTGTPDSFARGASAMPKLVLLWDEVVAGGGACG